MISAAKTRLTSATQLEEYRKRLLEEQDPQSRRVRICLGTGCTLRGALKVWEAFREAAEASNDDSVIIETKCTGCHGFCERGPVVVVDPGNVFYQKVKAEDVPEIWQETVLGGRVVESLLFEDEQTKKLATTPDEIPFYRGQERIALALNGMINPREIDEYIAAGGYAGMAKALGNMEPEAIVEEVHRSGLRGRGGGGFPAGSKWRATRGASGEPKYVIANGDEGDPGAFSDRSIMEGVPHAVIEGMVVAAYAIGSPEGYIYLRNDYSLAVEHLGNALVQARQLGLLGENILGSGFSFDIRINRGAGAFVCGESTALLASLEGRPGEPSATYIPTAESGLNGKPTLLHNVETWATVPAIIQKGADWYASHGTENSKGTKVFSLVGKVNNTGLVEVPMGTTLREIIFDIGGGIPNGKAFKAVQIGGPSGGCIPADCLDEPVDFERLTELGSMMGSGGLIVLDEDTCMVSVAKYFLEFLKQESCGKCTPCREGLAQMLEIVSRIIRGEGREEDIDNLEQLGELIEDTALCGLGRTAVNPVLSTVRRFREEYEIHIRDQHCPAKVCSALFRYEIDEETCKGCGLCAKKCPADGISGGKKQPHTIDQVECLKCGTCFEVCPFATVLRV